MALTPSITATQVIGLPGRIVLTDESSGSDVLITSRRVYITDYTGAYIVPDGNPSDTYILWPYNTTTINIDILDNDMALEIRTDFLDVSNAVLYSFSDKYAFTLYSEQFYYGLTQDQTASPNIIQDTNYYNNKMVLRCSIDEANQAITYAGDLYSSQSALDRAAYLIANENTMF